jgi:hypothetical protein
MAIIPLSEREGERKWRMCMCGKLARKREREIERRNMAERRPIERQFGKLFYKSKI